MKSHPMIKAVSFEPAKQSGHDKAIEILQESGARQLTAFKGDGNTSTLSMWTTRGGMVIVQSLSNGGVDVYLPATKGILLTPMLDALRDFLRA